MSNRIRYLRVWQFKGLGIDIIGRVHFGNRDKFAIWMGSIGKATEPCQQTSGCWHLWLLTVSWTLTWEMIRIRNFYCFVYRQHIGYDLENERWLLGDMIDHVGIYGSRVAEGLSAFNVGLVIVSCRRIRRQDQWWPSQVYCASSRPASTR